MISVQDVTKQFSNGKGLFHITFDVKRGRSIWLFRTEWCRKINDDS